MVGAFHGVPGARAFRRALAENCVKADAGVDQLRAALKLVAPAEIAGAAA
jgi:tRNA-dihydrouridine synthase A